ncbi:MAG: tetratricopeptide repeat protein [Robiginitomaculum sp.]|nr:tetratricopeptide repeat protein [Robiginitomaculum sp.]MDQ7078158.1 tetratricopeptide repeat protein [Robiginitomaculum sp.]
MKSLAQIMTILCVFPAMMVASAASADTFTIGQSYGAECYDNARSMGFSTASINACNRAIDDDTLTKKDRAATYVNRGIVRAYLEDYDGALADYAEALKLSPDLAEAFANRGGALIKLERFDSALEALNKALALSPKQPERVYYNRSIVYEIMGKTREAYEDLKKAAALAPQWTQPQRELQRYQVVAR